LVKYNPFGLKLVVMAKKTHKQIEREDKIYQLSTLVAGEFSLQEVLDKLAEAAVKIVGVKACSIRLLDEKAGELKMRSTYGLSEEYRNKGEVSKNDPVIKAAFAGEAIVLDDMRIDGRVKYREATIKEGLVSQLTVAMQFKNKPIGVLRLYSPKPKQFWEEDIHLARAVASQCSVAITNARLYARAIEGARMAEQVRLAGIVQRRMIPEKAPQVPGLDIAAEYIPCFDVGGDLYDFYRLSDKAIDVTIADVIGKGIPAAIMMSSFRGTIKAFIDAIGDFQTYCGNRDKTDCAREIIKRLNRMACRECRDGEFITLFDGAVDLDDMTITYCNCGHEPAILIRDGEIIELDKGGLVLGVDQNAEYEIGTVDLKEGDCLLFYTDGLIDAINFDNEFWGRENMLRAAKKFSALPAERMIKSLLGYRRRFVGLARQLDDMSIIVIKVGNS